MFEEDAILSRSADADSDRLLTGTRTELSRSRQSIPYVPDKSQKRGLSVGSTPSPSFLAQTDERYRADNSEFDWHKVNLAVNMEEEPEVTLSAIMAMQKQPK